MPASESPPFHGADENWRVNSNSSKIILHNDQTHGPYGKEIPIQYTILVKIPN